MDNKKLPEWKSELTSSGKYVEHSLVLTKNDFNTDIKLVVIESKEDKRYTGWMDGLLEGGKFYSNEFRDLEIAKTVLLQKARAYFQSLADTCANKLLEQLYNKGE